MDTDPDCTHPVATSTPKQSNRPSKRRNVNTAARNLVARQENSKRQACTPPPPAIVDLDQLPDPQPSKKGKWMETSFYTLSEADRAILLSPVGWLNDNLIVAAQNLLKKQSSIPGFQDTCLSQSMCFEIQRGEFIQILHDGHGHWLMISSAITEDGAQEIHVYDSMYPTVGRTQNNVHVH